MDYDEQPEGQLKEINHSMYVLQHNHKIQLLCDDGTHGKYKKEPDLRCNLEKYLRQTTIRDPDIDRGIITYTISAPE